jgi:aspartoacylase
LNADEGENVAPDFSEHRALHVALIGGTHGNELNGAWLIERWRRNGKLIARESFQTHLLLGNPKALHQVRRYVDQDLNRSFGDMSAPTPREVSRARNYEEERARVLREQLETFRVIPDGVLIDLHNTTANMGLSLIFVNRSQFNLKLAAWVQKHMPEVRAYCWLDETVPRRSSTSLVDRGITLEVGPVANGIVHGDLFWKTERTVQHMLDFIEAYNRGAVQFDGSDEVELFVHERSVDFPRDEKDRIAGFIHPELQDRDYQLLEPGAPIFQSIDGQVVRYSGEEGRYPVFVNEAAYYEKRIAFSLTRRETRRV